ncbi:MAG: amino acid adenylation domain-containing protein [Spirochaetales bacterium]|nr:amino acid adenylation domain-containing protein [Spirochaetales bacterium]
MLSRSTSTWINKTSFANWESWLGLFSEQVNSRPEHTALYFGSDRYSYRELDRISDHLAFNIMGNNKGDSPFIGLSLTRSPLMLASIIAIHKTGKAYLPLDPRFPRERLEYMVEDSGISLIITDGEIPPFENIANLKIDNSDLTKESERFEYKGCGNHAYMLYTSGSTGRPKGVVINHTSLTNFLLSMKQEPGFYPEDTSLALTTVSFDISILELLLPLICGGAVFLMPDRALYQPSGLVRIVNDNPVSLIQATPTVWKTLLEAGVPLKKGIKILSGGEALDRDLANSLLETGNEVWNMYGPTETTIWSSCQRIFERREESPPIGMPIDNTGFHILDEELNPVETGKKGQLWISGDGLADCYWHNPGKTEECFRILPGGSQLRIYSTGDYVRENDSGDIEYIGRVDNQVKIRGLRIEPEEIEKAVIPLEGISDAVVIAEKDNQGHTVLSCYYTTDKKGPDPDPRDFRVKLSRTLPDYMIPTNFFMLEELPLTDNKKIDRKALGRPSSRRIEENSIVANLDKRVQLRNLWENSLVGKEIKADDNFFDLGGHSLLAIEMTEKISRLTGQTIDPLFFFEYPSLNSQMEALFPGARNSIPGNELPDEEVDESDEFSLAIIGLSCEVPGADDPIQFWELLSQGRCGIRDLSDEELLKQGLDPQTLDRKDYVKKSGSLESAQYFDHRFFGYSPKESRFMDPQHRLMLQHAHKAFESAGIIPETYEGKIGVFASCGQNQYLLKNIFTSPERESWSDFQLMVGNENDFLATRLAYKFNLKGPALTVQSGCSSSLVSVQLAYQSLINYQCDMALAGGVSLNLPHNEGYLYKEGAIFSPDGVCRAFDEKASGTVFGSGIGVVLLKRLSDAIRDKDPVIAILRSAAVNNDGSEKIGYTAPGIRGQKEVIEEAIHLAGIKSSDISYVEAHGTGTKLGDPIEITALSQAFGEKKPEDPPWLIGSVKTNIGHLDAAAGIIGLIKTALALKEARIPASLNFLKANSELKLDKRPFLVNRELRDWQARRGRRIAGISSFGIGGTNAHAILEAYDGEVQKPSFSGRWLCHRFYGKSKFSVENYRNNLAENLKNLDETDKINCAFTLAKRKNYNKYSGYILTDMERGIELSDNGVMDWCPDNQTVFLIPGQNRTGVDFHQNLYRDDRQYRSHFNECLGVLTAMTDLKREDMKRGIVPDDTEFQQPLLFAMEWSICRTLMDHGVSPRYLLGHSLGEYVAAVVAGALDLETGLRVVVKRGQIMSHHSGGQMIVLREALEDIRKLIPENVDIAAVNSESQFLLSGPLPAMDILKSDLEKQEIPYTIMNRKYAFHSQVLSEAAREFSRFLEEIIFQPLKIPVYSNLRGEILDKGFVYSARYWSDHMVGTVLFHDSIRELSKRGPLIFIETGAGQVLGNLVKSILKNQEIPLIPASEKSDLIAVAAEIEATGIQLDPDPFGDILGGEIIPLPPYIFNRDKHWIAPARENPIEKTSPGIEESVQSTDEKRLKEIWKDVLGYDEIHRDINFFEQGGDSLLAVELLNRINEAFALSLHLREVLLNPEFYQMYNVIMRERSRAASEEKAFPLMFPAQRKGSRTPLFLVAGAHENRYFNPETLESSYEEDFLRYFSSLIGFLGPDQPVYGFRPKGIIFGESPHRNVREMASDIIKLIKSVQKEGPYLIGGECVGGSVAYEVAQQLSEEGETVENLILMDTPRPSLKRLLAEEKKYHKNRLYNSYHSGRGTRYFLRNVFDTIQIFIPHGPGRKSIIQVSESSLFYQRKLLSYKPERYSGKATLIVNQEWHDWQPNLGWDREVLPLMDIYVVPGDHVTRLSRYGKLSAEIINQSLGGDDHRDLLPEETEELVKKGS